MGDLGPPMVAKLADIGGPVTESAHYHPLLPKFPVVLFATSSSPESTANLRMVVLSGLALFVALPLSLVRDLENLQYICASRYSLQVSAHTHAYMSQ